MSYNNTDCWFPDQGSKLDYLVPCNPTAAHSACCTFGESCTANGYCYGVAGILFRGACTDSTFRDPACPQKCIGESGSNVDTSDISLLEICESNYGSGRPPLWTCGSYAGCSQYNFTLSLGLIVYSNITGNFTATTTSIQSSATVTVTAGPQSDHGTTSATATIATGVVLGVALLVALGVIGFLLRKGRKVRRNDQPYQPVSNKQYDHNTGNDHNLQDTNKGYHSPPQPSVSQFDDQTIGRAELHNHGR